MNTLLRYWHTVKFLKPIQIYGRIWFRLYKPVPKNVEQVHRRTPACEIGAGASRRSTLTSALTFHLLGETVTVNHPSDWNDAKQNKLLLYDLHYFDDLNATPSNMELSLIHI